MPSVCCAPKQAFTGWFANRLSILPVVDTPVLPVFLCTLKSTTRLKLTSIRQTCAQTPSVPAAQAVSTSTKPIQLCDSHTYPLVSSCSAKTDAASTATVMWLGNDCVRGFTTMKCANAWKRSKSWKTPKPMWAGDTKSAVMCWTKVASKICVPT